MKKLFAGILAVVLLLLLVSCGAPGQDAPASDAQASAEPEDTTRKIALVAEDAEAAALFFEGVNTVLPEDAEIQQISLADYTDGDADGVIAHLATEAAKVDGLEQAAARGAAVAVFDAAGAKRVEGAMYFCYDETGAQEQMLQEALAYPPHDTPVRLMGMFTNAQSEAYAAWESYCAEGKIFSKAVYLEADSETDGKIWFAEQMTQYYPGMLDAVYVETEAMALAVGEVMQSLGRDDAEIFVCGGSDLLIAQMRENPRLFAATVGMNSYYAGAYTATAALKALDGTAVTDVTFTPYPIYAADIAEGNDGFFTEAMQANYPMN